MTAKEILELKKRKHYGTAVLQAVNSYGIESAFFNAKNKKMSFGLEEIDEELEANETTDYEETGSMWDSEPTDFENGEDRVEEDPNDNEEPAEDGMNEDWQEVNPEDLKSEADTISMMDILGQYTNDYALTMEGILKSSEDAIDFTGDFKSNVMYQNFVIPAMELIDKYYKEEDITKKLYAFKLMLEEKQKMVSINGQPDNPFIYQGLQLMFYETARTLLALIPFCIKQNMKLNELITNMKYTTAESLFKMITDMVDISPMFGPKIFYVEPIKSEITGKNEDLANTPYASMPTFQVNSESIMTRMILAGENIMNLVEIRNNKALVEYSLICKALVVIAGLCKDMNIKEACDGALVQATVVLNADGDNLDSVLTTATNYFRNEVILKQINKMTEIAKKEQEKMTDPENMPTGGDVTEETKPESEEEPIEDDTESAESEEENSTSWL